MQLKALKKRAALKDVANIRTKKADLVRATIVVIAAILLILFAGFILFLYQVQQADNARPVRADAIVVFSGEPKRVEVGTRLLARGFAPLLVIVGQDNADEIAIMRAQNPRAFSCCVKVDQRSTNTAEDAERAKELLAASSARHLILVTSSFHMPRARLELNRQLRAFRIIPIGVSDSFYNVEGITTSRKVASAFLFQYALYVISWIPGSRYFWNENDARWTIGIITNVRNIALILLAMSSAIVGAFALRRHRDRNSPLS